MARKVVPLLLLLVAVSGSLPAAPATAVPATGFGALAIAMGWTSETNFSIVGGVPVKVGIGSIIGAGVPSGGMRCLVVDPIVLGRYVPEGGAGNVTLGWKFDATCIAKVTSIGSSGVTKGVTGYTTYESKGLPGPAADPAPEPDGPGPHHEHALWGRSWVEEYVNWTTTDRYTIFRYHETSEKVYGGYGNEGDCWRNGTHWTITDCTFQWQPNGPAWVHKWAWGHYSSSVPPQPDYTLNIELWDVYKQYGWAYDCYVTDGEIPRGWENKCKANRQSP